MVGSTSLDHARIPPVRLKTDANPCAARNRATSRLRPPERQITTVSCVGSSSPRRSATWPMGICLRPGGTGANCVSQRIDDGLEEAFPNPFRAVHAAYQYRIHHRRDADDNEQPAADAQRLFE